MSLSLEEVKKIAELARVELSTNEMDSFSKQLGAILSYVHKLDELDTSGIEPMSHSVTAAGDAESAMRHDDVQPCLGQELATANAPDAEDGFFRVPRVIGA